MNLKTIYAGEKVNFKQMKEPGPAVSRQDAWSVNKRLGLPIVQDVLDRSARLVPESVRGPPNL